MNGFQLLSLILIFQINAVLPQKYTFANISSSLCTLSSYQYCNSFYNIQFRTFDGACNNVAKPWLGKSNTPYQRFSTQSSAYSSALGDPRFNTVAGKKLMSPRDVAINMLFPNDISSNISTFHLFFGKLISTDLTDAAKPLDSNGRYMSCNCTKNDTNCLVMPTTPKDAVNQDQECMATPRSVGTYLNWNCGPSFREQLNQQTSWLDLSVLYGKDNTSANLVREFSNGFLSSQMLPNQTRAVFKSAPYPANSNQCLKDTLATQCFQSGDNRMNINTALTSVNVLFLRQHNLIAKVLKNQSKSTNLTDDLLFQKARRINIALYQHIIYNEWLPLVIGPNLMTKFNLKPLLNGSFNSYSSVIFNQIINEFATAAFRFAHNMVPNKLNKADQNLIDYEAFNLTSFTYTPTDAYTKGGLDSICRGLIKNQAIAPDTYHSDQIHNHLFDVGVMIGQSKRASLTAFNIQRGRDHGLKPYNAYRNLVGLTQAAKFNDLLTNISPERIALLQKAYTNVNDIDLYPGGLSETNLPGAIVGQTFGSN